MLNLTARVPRSVQWTKLSVYILTSYPAMLGIGHPEMIKTPCSPLRSRAWPGRAPVHPQPSITHATAEAGFMAPATVQCAIQYA